MAALSDQLLVAAVFGYLAAMLCHLAEYAFGRTGSVTRTVVRTAEPALVAAAKPAQFAATAARAAPRPAQPASHAWADRAGQAAVWLLAIAVATHAGVLLTRGLAAGRVPWGNMYEFVVALSVFGAITWLVLAVARPQLRPLGLFVTIALVLMLGFAGMVLYTEAGPLVPALNSYWLKIHVSAAALSSGVLLVAFVPTALYLVREGYDRAGLELRALRFPYTLGRRLPAAATLDQLSLRLHAFAFPIWTFAIICGAIWAEAAWGRYWGWDPKEVWSFVSWVAYAAYLHARATPSVRRTTAAWFAVAAWTTMLINLYVINFVAVGLHSYAGTE
jgi:cytochrome c-type biogenesis protein CcsB